jgi:hypothetical protein
MATAIVSVAALTYGQPVLSSALLAAAAAEYGRARQVPKSSLPRKSCPPGGGGTRRSVRDVAAGAKW